MGREPVLFLSSVYGLGLHFSFSSVSRCCDIPHFWQSNMLQALVFFGLLLELFYWPLQRRAARRFRVRTDAGCDYRYGRDRRLLLWALSLGRSVPGQTLISDSSGSRFLGGHSSSAWACSGGLIRLIQRSYQQLILEEQESSSRYCLGLSLVRDIVLVEE